MFEPAANRERQLERVGQIANWAFERERVPSNPLSPERTNQIVDNRVTHAKRDIGDGSASPWLARIRGIVVGRGGDGNRIDRGLTS